MPKITESQMTGDFGENYIKTIVETGWGCIFIGSGDRDRFGIDGTVIYVLNGKVQPLQFNVQVKAGSFENIGKLPKFRAPITKDNIELWREMNVPVVLICVDKNLPTKAYWHLVQPNDELPIYINRKDEFGPSSRDVVVGTIKKAKFKVAPKTYNGRILKAPLNTGIRMTAKKYYNKLKTESVNHPIYGNIVFTWRGWRHITRKIRSSQKIHLTLQLLPCIKEIF